MKHIFTTILLVLIFSSGYTQDIETGLVARYSFCGNLNDDSDNGNNGTFMGNGDPTYTDDHTGTAQSALFFNGFDSYVSIPPSVTMNSPIEEATVSCWFNYISLTNGWGVLCAKTNQQTVLSREYSLGFNDNGQIYWHSTYVAQTTLEPNTWYHVTVTYTPEILKCYLNGEFIGEAVPNDLLVGNDLPFEIGRDTPVVTEIFHGSIDEVNVYNRALSATDVWALKNHDGCNPASIQASELLNKVSYYPNPVGSELTVNLPDENPYVVTIFNNLGQSVYSGTYQQTIVKLNVSQFKEGFYTIHISNGNAIYINKFIKFQ